jgi:transaldolase
MTFSRDTVVAGERWARLAAAGARLQRPLWASTGVKDPAYPDTMYVTELVAPGTVNTMPGTTLAAFADHGTIIPDAVQGGYSAARAHLDTLEREGLAKFEKSWDELGHTVGRELHATTR